MLRMQPLGALACIATLSGHADRVWCCTWSPSGALLATCGGDKSIRIYARSAPSSAASSAASDSAWECRFTLEGVHHRTVRNVAWSPCGRFLASASFDATVGIWAFRDGDFECVATLEGHENEVKSVAWDATGRLLATCSRDKSVWIWESAAEGEFDCMSVLHDHSQDVKCVRWHPTRAELVSCSYDDTIRVWTDGSGGDGDDDDEWRCAATLRAHSSTVWAVAFHRTDDACLASCSDDATIRIWRRLAHSSGGKSEYTNVCTLAGKHTRTVFSVDWSPDGYLCAGGGDDALVIYREAVRDGDASAPAFQYECCFTLERAHTADVNCVAWAPAVAASSADALPSPLLATASDDGTVKLWRFTPPEV